MEKTNTNKRQIRFGAIVGIVISVFITNYFGVLTPIIELVKEILTELNFNFKWEYEVIDEVGKFVGETTLSIYDDYKLYFLTTYILCIVIFLLLSSGVFGEFSLKKNKRKSNAKLVQDLFDIILILCLTMLLILVLPLVNLMIFAFIIFIDVFLINNITQIMNLLNALINFFDIHIEALSTVSIKYNDNIYIIVFLRTILMCIFLVIFVNLVIIPILQKLIKYIFNIEAKVLDNSIWLIVNLLIFFVYISVFVIMDITASEPEKYRTEIKELNAIKEGLVAFLFLQLPIVGITTLIKKILKKIYICLYTRGVEAIKKINEVYGKMIKSKNNNLLILVGVEIVVLCVFFVIAYFASKNESVIIESLIIPCLTFIGIIITVCANHITNKERIKADLLEKARIEWIQSVRGVTVEVISKTYQLFTYETYDKDYKSAYIDIIKDIEHLILYFGPDSKKINANTDKGEVRDILLNPETNDGKNQHIVKFLDELMGMIDNYNKAKISYSKEKRNIAKSINVQEYEKTDIKEKEITKESLEKYTEARKALQKKLVMLRDIMRIYLKLEWTKVKTENI